MPTAFASLTGQVLRDLQRCRLCHFLAIVAQRSATSRCLFEMLSPATNREQVVSLSFDSSTLPRLTSLASFGDTSSPRLIEHCASGSELSIHTVIHHPQQPPPSMETSITSSTNFGAPPSLASSMGRSKPSCYSDSETESISRGIRQPSLAPMQPLLISEQDSKSPIKKNQRYQRLKRFASSRMRRQQEQQKMWAMLAAVKRGPSAAGNSEIWIDGPAANATANAPVAVTPTNVTNLTSTGIWIDGPKKNRENVVANPQLHSHLQHELQQDLHRRSLPRPVLRKQQHLPQPQYQSQTAKKPHQRNLRPPSISCSSENLLFDSGFYPQQHHQQQQQQHQYHHLHQQQQPVQQRNVTWTHYDVHSNTIARCYAKDDSTAEAMKKKQVPQSPFLKLKNKLLGKKSPQVPSPALVPKRNHVQQPVVPSAQNPNRISRLTDTSDSGNDSGVALFGKLNINGNHLHHNQEDAASTTTGSSVSPGSPVDSNGVNGQSNQPGKPTTAGSLCSHSSGRGSSSSLLRFV